MVGWLVGHTGDLWPNDERYFVGLNRGHIGKFLWAFDWAPSDLTLDDLEGSKTRSYFLTKTMSRRARVTMLDRTEII